MDADSRHPRAGRCVVRGPSHSAGTVSLRVPREREGMAHTARSHRREGWIRWRIGLAHRERDRASVRNSNGGTMYKIAISLIALAPAVLAAQVGAGASARSDTKASAQVGRSTNADFSSSTSVDAELSAARAHHVP